MFYRVDTTERAENYGNFRDAAQRAAYEQREGRLTFFGKYYMWNAPYPRGGIGIGGTIYSSRRGWDFRTLTLAQERYLKEQIRSEERAKRNEEYYTPRTGVRNPRDPRRE